MANGVDDKNSNLGYYSLLELEKNEFVGGLLVLNSNGRPLEFHCTTPVKANRPQQVLFGNSLKRFIVGESILPRLVSECKNNVDFVLADDPDATEAQKKIEQPIVVMDLEPYHEEHERRGVKETDGDRQERVDVPEIAEPSSQFRSLIRLRLKSLDFWIDPSIKGRKPEVSDMLTQVANAIIIDEPFQRVQMAIRESQGIKN